MDWFVTSTEATGPNNTFIKPEAFECPMEFCVKTYTANMSKGVFTEQVISEYPGFNNSLPNEPSVPEGNWVAVIPFHSLAKRNFTMKPPGQDTVYSVDAATNILLKTWLVPIVNKLGYGAYEELDIYNDLGEALFEGQTTTSGPQEALNHTTQIVSPGPDFSRLSNIVTAYLRRSGSPDTAVNGISYAMQTYVHVQW